MSIQRRNNHAVDDEALARRTSVRPLDLERNEQRYGTRTRGGVGTSIPG